MERRDARRTKQHQRAAGIEPSTSQFTCFTRSRACGSRIGLHSHEEASAAPALTLHPPVQTPLLPWSRHHPPRWTAKMRDGVLSEEHRGASPSRHQGGNCSHVIPGKL
ncbi:hypothetical protein SKAU_G00045550 [Synaphobranchus kaupii]|uniref:Uncharacterized protein n=1 Tax=Synaphobranchus kaupii TaxID=118154 RepID=A0A9Q1G243_SYNKA|nr:hypothetical protein SKAU_G00045550 [Synaphobranchus kaupii]